ncbi:adenosylcobalamin-dependent ribonucleoside-diphosphate reductase [Nocardia sp. NBC_01503]|uniref:adenosylcobalamin-dependent ribonucleoside-diphosphate reductase n=1 Tax=Nocardia sp. NBC_01503 TaxID=2975997 RepID=UPI002E7B30DD|nr:adenosylcobalamin-dependent ribonucleoside-diphosphate reductase [Nocardia sp. NBC_01503]WTL31035.1 adenosylcobalamin-dependent ribonucleoside-diphosphate reductase [Nocardia sp. NBC_01503]
MRARDIPSRPVAVDRPEQAAVADDLGLSPAAFAVVAERYLRRDGNGRVCESPGQMMDRVARFVARAEDDYRPGGADRWAPRFAALLRSREFLPNSPTLMNAGTGIGVLSGCFVLPIEDSLDSIFTTLHTTARLHRAGAGTGFSFSRLRPRGDTVASGGHASGPISFIELYAAAARAIRFDGRRGANMAVLDVHHPDIQEFVRAKAKPGALPTFNLSVGVTDEFMRAATADQPYALINPRTGRTVRRISARAVLETIAAQAWHTGEPGILFLDTINRADPLPELGPLEATNPCGEVPLAPYESCNLGSIALARFLDGDHLDDQRLERAVRVAVRFLDDVIDVSTYPAPELAAAALATRKIGLGIMGLAETLAVLGLPYDSVAAVDFARGLMARITGWAHDASRELAAERGAFPLFEDSCWAADGDAPLRNAQLTAIAPTGTISLLAGTSAGIEPLYALSYTRNMMGRDFAQAAPLFERVAVERGIWSPEIAAEIAATGTAAHPDIPADLHRRFLTAHELDQYWQVEMQAAVQRNTDAAVAKTVNLPETADIGEVRNAFLHAWRAGCKGVTVYRSGSRADQVLRHPVSDPHASNHAAP